jgi:hypothetical protein
MKLLRKAWFRIIISVFAGGFVTEIIHISTGDPNRPRTANLSLLYAIIIFGLLTFLAKLPDEKKL